MPPTLWIDADPQAELDGDGVKLSFASGSEKTVLRMTRSSFRRLVELGSRELNEDEMRQQMRVAAVHGVCPFSPADRCH